jgi:hypothetical protein
MTSCATNDCIYINCQTRKKILRLDIAEGAESEWTIDRRPTGLSVNCASNLIVTCCFPDALMEFTTHGSLIRDIILQSEVSCPRHAVQLSDGQFVVCRGGYGSHLVCRVSSIGRPVVSFGCKPESENEQLKEPRHVALVADGKLLVADSMNSRIRVLDNRLRSLSCDMFSIDVSEPVALCYDESQDRLYVGEWKGGRVLAVHNLSSRLVNS